MDVDRGSWRRYEWRGAVCGRDGIFVRPIRTRLAVAVTPQAVIARPTGRNTASSVNVWTVIKSRLEVGGTQTLSAVDASKLFGNGMSATAVACGVCKAGFELSDRTSGTIRT